MKKPLLPILPFTKQQVFLAATGIVLVFNLITLTQESIKMHQQRQNHPYVFLGDRFRGIDAVTQNASYIGYYTDKNLDINQAAMQYAQAQLVLAPSILDLNNTGHEYIIFDCSSPLVSLAKIKALGLKPLMANDYGIILAYNPRTAKTHTGSVVPTFDKTRHKQRL